MGSRGVFDGCRISHVPLRLSRRPARMAGRDGEPCRPAETRGTQSAKGNVCRKGLRPACRQEVLLRQLADVAEEHGEAFSPKQPAGRQRKSENCAACRGFGELSLADGPGRGCRPRRRRPAERERLEKRFERQEALFVQERQRRAKMRFAVPAILLRCRSIDRGAAVAASSESADPFVIISWRGPFYFETARRLYLAFSFYPRLRRAVLQLQRDVWRSCAAGEMGDGFRRADSRSRSFAQRYRDLRKPSVAFRLATREVAATAMSVASAKGRATEAFAGHPASASLSPIAAPFRPMASTVAEGMGWMRIETLGAGDAHPCELQAVERDGVRSATGRIDFAGADRDFGPAAFADARGQRFVWLAGLSGIAGRAESAEGPWRRGDDRDDQRAEHAAASGFVHPMRMLPMGRISRPIANLQPICHHKP